VLFISPANNKQPENYVSSFPNKSLGRKARANKIKLYKLVQAMYSKQKSPQYLLKYYYTLGNYSYSLIKCGRETHVLDYEF